jgi:hypothetical protein
LPAVQRAGAHRLGLPLLAVRWTRPRCHVHRDAGRSARQPRRDSHARLVPDRGGRDRARGVHARLRPAGDQPLARTGGRAARGLRRATPLGRRPVRERGLRVARLRMRPADVESARRPRDRRRDGGG